ncbi:glutathione S-transferase [Mycena rebaudengoi]|nr:glutathione S-transferase [Mycena rebaudengoi]
MTTKPIMLYTLGTPNGRKISVFLEELKAAYGQDLYEIPTIVDRSRNDFTVFETGAILLYLQQHYDKEGRFSFPPGSDESNEVLQWMFWANGGLGPMMGQAEHFSHIKEQIPYAQGRYSDETKRLFGVLEIRLKDREYLVGNKLTIADINAYTWVNIHTALKIKIDGPA